MCVRVFFVWLSCVAFAFRPLVLSPAGACGGRALGAAEASEATGAETPALGTAAFGPFPLARLVASRGNAAAAAGGSRRRGAMPSTLAIGGEGGHSIFTYSKSPT